MAGSGPSHRTGVRGRLLNSGTSAPDFAFGNDTNFISLSQLKGNKRILLSLCAEGLTSFCRDGIRAVAREWPEYKKREMLVIMISGTTQEQLAEYADSEPAPVVMIMDERRETIAAYGARGMRYPIVYLIGKDGTIQYAWTHWPSNREVFEMVDGILARQEQTSDHHEAA